MPDQTAGDLDRKGYGINPWSGRATGSADQPTYRYDAKSGKYKQTN